MKSSPLSAHLNLSMAQLAHIRQVASTNRGRCTCHMVSSLNRLANSVLETVRCCDSVVVGGTDDGSAEPEDVRMLQELSKVGRYVHDVRMIILRGVRDAIVPAVPKPTSGNVRFRTDGLSRPFANAINDIVVLFWRTAMSVHSAYLHSRDWHGRTHQPQ